MFSNIMTVQILQVLILHFFITPGEGRRLKAPEQDTEDDLVSEAYSATYSYSCFIVSCFEYFNW